eukprot:TRINITY_DN13558_c0_g1_i1.p1 TRINITY_DN13558_c0_g1~~TRINITY_DN13558_c0_g1_i1.p1  ORF type:complete len:499 (-),score=52.17 TRINITY_DN13558_c0_g1_i1:33-1529(-)
MIDYRAGTWGFHVAIGWKGSLVPRAVAVAFPNAILTFIVATLLADDNKVDDDTAKAAQLVIGAFTSVMVFVLYNRSNTAYDRWWEGGTLLQKARGEWFNAYSSIMAFTSTKPEMQEEVQAYCHLVARLMSLLMCCGLQQVSPHRDRPFEIIDLAGIEPESMEFLNSAPDKVEIILQWIQRSMVLSMHTGVLPVAPPILSRAFQEVSRGIVNLQNARKIADFPYPYPLAQISMILQLIHWIMIPVSTSLALPRTWAVLFSFFSIFVLWCIHFNALDLEFPFGTRVNDLPMDLMQQDWNKSICMLLDRRATRPPSFAYDWGEHKDLTVVMSDASDLYVPIIPIINKGGAIIKVADRDFAREHGKTIHVAAHSPCTAAARDLGMIALNGVASTGVAAPNGIASKTGLVVNTGVAAPNWIASKTGQPGSSVRWQDQGCSESVPSSPAQKTTPAPGSPASPQGEKTASSEPTPSEVCQRQAPTRRGALSRSLCSPACIGFSDR